MSKNGIWEDEEDCFGFNSLYKSLICELLNKSIKEFRLKFKQKGRVVGFFLLLLFVVGCFVLFFFVLGLGLVFGFFCFVFYTCKRDGRE